MSIKVAASGESAHPHGNHGYYVPLDKVQILNCVGDEDGDFATNFPQKKKKSGRQVRKRSEAETVPPDYWQ